MPLTSSVKTSHSTKGNVGLNLRKDKERRREKKNRHLVGLMTRGVSLYK